jgi:SPP1 gp7 family putative phage head morphogenesis protein
MNKKHLLKPINNPQAVEFLQQKSNRVTPLKAAEIASAWSDEARAKAFFSARVMKADILAEIRRRTQQVLDGKGTTSDARHWIKEFLKTDGDNSLFECGFLAVNSSESIAELGSTRRINLIVDQNVRMAQEVGHYAECQDDKDIFPYVRYDSENDEKTRPSHRALDGKIFRVDDPVTAQIWPPNGFGCRCNMVQLDESDIAGHKIEPNVPTEYFNAKAKESDTFTFNPATKPEPQPPRDSWPDNLKQKYASDIKKLTPETLDYDKPETPGEAGIWAVRHQLADKVDYAKLKSMELINETNRAIYELKQQTGITFNEISTVSLPTKKDIPMKTITAYEKGKLTNIRLEINNAYFEKEKLNNLATVNKHTLKQHQSGHWIPQTYAGIIQHEYGHLLTTPETYAAALSVRDLPGLNVSQYARRNTSETLAEIYALSQSEPEKLKPEWVDFFNKHSKIKLDKPKGKK